jgi:putative two-component system response regulator
MAERSSPRAAPSAADLLADRVRTLETLKDFHREVLGLVRAYVGAEDQTLEQCLGEVCGSIQRKLNLYAVAVLLLEESTQELVQFVCKSQEPTLTGKPSTYRIGLQRGLTGQCARTGATIVANDTQKDPVYVPGPLPQTRSELCVPLKVGTRTMGVLDVHAAEPHRFRHDITELLEEIAVAVSFVLENHRLYDTLRRRSEKLETKVAEQVTQLTEQENRFRLMIDNSAEPILMIDTDGRISYGNYAAQRLAGLQAEGLTGLHAAKLFAKGSIHKFYSVFRQVLEHKKPRPVRVEMVNQVGDVRSVELAALPIIQHGLISGIHITVRDVTEKLAIDKLKKNYLKSLEEEVSSRISEIKDTQRAAIFAIATLAESIDEDTGGHLERIRHYCKALAEEMRRLPKYTELITDEYAELLFDLSPLHDLGKVGIRDYILLKDGKLTEEEFAIMQQHTEIGARALRTAGQMIHRESIFSIGEMIAHYHHERWDGTGYPAVEVNGERRPLRGEEIPLCARIVALADVYDALTSKRPYKHPFPHPLAKERILGESGKHFDPEVVQAFVRIEDRFQEIRRQYPDTLPTIGTIFELPERDRAPDAARAAETSAS